MTNTKEFKIAMLRAGYTNESLAPAIGMSKATLSYKINNLREFTVSEIKKIQETLRLSDEERDLIFFAR